jgi:hypothetical protein
MVMAPVLLVAAIWCAVLLVYAALLVRQALRSARLDGLRLRLLWWWPLLLASPSRLERRVVRRVLAAGVPDRCRRVVWLPADIEVLVAPRDLRVLGPAAERVGTRVRRRLEWLERTQACRFHLPPCCSANEFGASWNATARRDHPCRSTASTTLCCTSATLSAASPSTATCSASGVST